MIGVAMSCPRNVRRTVLRAIGIVLASSAFLSWPYSVLAEEPLASGGQPIDFIRDVRPVLEKHCTKCHGEDEQQGGLRLDVRDDALRGGDSGPVIVPAKGAESLLILRVTSKDASERMPQEGPPLTAVQVAILRAWIDQGAKWPAEAEPKGLDKRLDHWAFQPLRRPRLPAVRDAAWVRTPIDRFILAKLDSLDLRPAAEADRRTLIRRLSFDLVGLPPEPDRVDAFVADNDPLAYEKLVDELLASPHYGERWARHWLDVVQFGETHGYDKDKPRPNAWPYRDYVIRALNDDKPFGRFVEEQIAGDVLYPGTADGIEALGFIAAGPWDFIGHAELPETKIDGMIARHLDRDDMVGNALGTFCSLTVQCAQCHNHKFDPITQEDYYGLQAVFAAVDRADKAYDVDPAVARRRQELAARHSELSRKKTDLDKRTADGGTQTEREAVARQLAELSAELSRLPHQRLVYAGTVHHGSGTFVGTGPSGGRPRPIRILTRGDVKRPGKEVGPGPIAALSQRAGLPGEFDLPPGHSEGDRRAALARWITDPKNPLTWRSIVNRVWQYHFGRGLVETPNDLGHMGQRPSHPELLEWVAVEFRDGGQSLKALHRLIVTSAVYRQSSTWTSLSETRNRISERRGHVVDADNRYLWRMNRRKLEAESVRDAALAVAGQLDRRMGGPSYQDFVIEQPEHSPHYEYHKHDPTDWRTHRRSIYRFIVRSQPQPFMTTLDCADPSMRVDKRNESLAAAQALAMLNDGLMLTLSKHFAGRLERQAGAGSTHDARLVEAFRIALARPPSEAELSALREVASTHGLPTACRVIFNLNEFAFAD